MSYCQKSRDPKYNLEVAKITKALKDSNAAVAVLESNNDYPLSQAPNGKESNLYQSLKIKLEETNPLLTPSEVENQTIRLKSVVYSSQFKNWFGDWQNGVGSKMVDENGEPIIFFGVNTKEVFNLAKESNNTVEEANVQKVYTFSRNQVSPDQNGYYIKSVNPTANEITEDSDALIIDNENESTITVKNSSQVKSAINTYKTFNEDIRDEHPGYPDTELQALFEANKQTEYAWRAKIDLPKFMNYLQAHTKYQNLFQLLKTNKDKTKPSWIQGLKIYLESNHDAVYGADAVQTHELYRARRAYYVDSINGGELHINIDANFEDGDADSVIWHELMHRMTVRKLQDPTNRAKFQKILDDYLQKYPDYRYRGNQGLEEFVANIWFDPQTIRRLQSIKSPRDKKTLWEKIKSFFQEWIRGEIADDSLFAEASYELTALLQTQERQATEQIFREHIGSLPNETAQIVKLIQYQRSWQGTSQADINEEITDYLKGKVKASVRNLLDKVQIRQAELHVLGYDFNDQPEDNWNWGNYLGGIDLDVPITKENLDPSKFTKLIEYHVDPAEIVVPKLYRSAFRMGGHYLSEINADFFKKVNPFYESKFGDSVDFIVRTHTNSTAIIVKDSLQMSGLKTVTPEIKDGWRVNPKGDHLYKLPDDASMYQIYKDNYGNELIVFKDLPETENTIKRMFNSVENIVSIQPLLQNVKNPADYLQMCLEVKKVPIQTFRQELNAILDSDKDIAAKLLDLYKKGEFQYQSDLSNTLYNSFVRTLYMMSVRIPTQAFQSIMAAKVAELTDDSKNAIFVNRWQFWLQGSDLDVDKSYLMGVDVSPTGIYTHWSPIADYTTEKLAEISDRLPLPNGKIFTLPEEHYKHRGETIIDIQVGSDDITDPLITAYFAACRNKDKEAQLSITAQILDYLKDKNEWYVNPSDMRIPAFKRLLRNINRHNGYKVPEGAVKNVIQKKIFEVSLDERNMKPGYSPIDEAVQMFKTLLDDIETPGANTKNLDDGISKFRLQFANSIGKQDVGVMANGLKMFLALTQYFNHFRKEDNARLKAEQYSTRQFLVHLNLKTGDKYFGKLSDIQYEKEAMRAFSKYAQLISGKPLPVEDRMDDATQLLSGLISLAVDNAKELALDRMNAALDLACMHLYLVSLGCSADEVVDAVTKNEAFKALANDLQNSSKLTHKRRVLSTWFNPTPNEIDNGWNKYQIPGYNQLKFLYNAAQEYTNGARILGINQGVLNDEFEIEKRYQSLSNLIKTQIENLGIEIKVSAIDSYYFKPSDTYTLIVKQTNLDTVDPRYIATKEAGWATLMQENDENHYIDSSLQVDLKRFYGDEEYKDFIIRLYDYFKITYNLYEMLDSLPHYNKMLEAFVVAENIITKSNRAKWLMKDSKNAYEEHQISTFIDKEIPGTMEHYSVRAFNTKPFDTSAQKKANRFYDMQILKMFLSENHDQYKFSYKDSNNKKQTIDLVNNENILKFAEFVTYDLIPALKEMFPKNKFLQYLRPDYKKASKAKDPQIYLPKYTFNFDIDKLNSTTDENKLFYINHGFNEIGDLTLNDVFDDVIDGGNLTVADLIMLNDRITSMSSYGQSSLDKAFNLYQQTHKNTIPIQIARIIQELDLGVRPPINFNSVEFLAYCYQNQIRRFMDGVMQYDYNSDTKTTKSFEIKNQYLIGYGHETESQIKEVQLAEDLINLLLAEKFYIANEQTPNGLWQQNLMYKDHVLATIKTSRFSDGVADTSVEELIQALRFERNSDESFAKLLEDYINEAKTEIQKPELKSYETLATYKTMAKRFAALGIPVEITNGVENGKVENGIIYLNPKADITQTAMHELMHLVMGVMKMDNYHQFEKLLNVVRRNQIFQEILEELNRSEEYENMMDNDKREEAFCRMIELLCAGKMSLDQFVDSNNQDLESRVGQLINPYISKTFGVIEPRSFISFLGNMISSLPAFNSSILPKPKRDTTGYMQQKLKVIDATRIAAFIKDSIAKQLITEVEC